MYTHSHRGSVVAKNRKFVTKTVDCVRREKCVCSLGCRARLYLSLYDGILFIGECVKCGKLKLWVNENCYPRAHAHADEQSRWKHKILRAFAQILPFIAIFNYIDRVVCCVCVSLASRPASPCKHFIFSFMQAIIRLIETFFFVYNQQRCFLVHLVLG